MHLKMKSQFYFFLPPFLVFGPASPATLPPACSFFFSFPHRLFCYLGRPMPKPKRGAAVAFPICGWHAGPASQRHRLPLVADPDSSSTFLPADAEYRDRTLRVCMYPTPRALLSAPINTAAPPLLFSSATRASEPRNPSELFRRSCRVNSLSPKHYLREVVEPFIYRFYALLLLIWPHRDPAVHHHLQERVDRRRPFVPAFDILLGEFPLSYAFVWYWSLGELCPKTLKPRTLASFSLPSMVAAAPESCFQPVTSALPPRFNWNRPVQIRRP